ncbi:unnamed protein product [Symbiodinium pilosum]|uniref:Uncharacterized protein n=1 Tax=Symbiodinium pilosum TaxID=2952 RepID=A0A812QTR0_SYMPI|nr:unnamed protein product [Symbiodinium pilosum]
MILIVLMVVWTGYVDIHPKRPLDLIEFFAGHAAIARNGVVSGYRCAALDLDFDSMRDPQRRLRLDKRSPFDLNSDSGFALAVVLILQGAWSQLVGIFATCCSSFVQINSGTSGRDMLTPEGRVNLPSVARSNKLLSRTVSM